MHNNNISDSDTVVEAVDETGADTMSYQLIHEKYEFCDIFNAIYFQ